MHEVRTWVAAWQKIPMAWAGLLLIGLMVFLGVWAPWLAPYDPDATGGPPLSPPTAQHWLGTNALGQDVYSQLLFSCRTSLLVGLSVGTGATLLGFVVGAAAGYYPRVLGVVLMRLVDVLMTVPRLPLIVLLAVFLGPSLFNVILVLIFLSWPGIARTIRSYVLSLRERDYLKFVRFAGGGFIYVLRRHLLAELLPLLIAKVVSTASYGIAAEAGLSFLGLGDPTTKSWGMMIRGALNYPGILWTPAWTWWFLPPAVAVSLAILGFTLTGYALEESLTSRNKEVDHEDRAPHFEGERA
ncbi:ABC transporter permease [Desulfovirgula thermocuniculi]|uniref:ABC transporter permease n=1 Tax=Desulfovirgula thermocuniculi TaxID=348842 RepID=UPI000402CAD2|nr:ABC transporter permease [Desulfovirgula thermocuniculi]